MTLIDEPLLTRVMSREDFSPDPGATYLYGQGIEDRATLESKWRATSEASGVAFVEVLEQETKIVLKGVSSSELLTFTGRQRDSIRAFFSARGVFYIDITGMPYTVWAPMLLAAIEAGANFRVVYVEPTDYRRSATPTRGLLFDLSDGFNGISPIPGFATLRTRPNSDWHLVAALGFEGDRFSHVVNDLEPAKDQIFPVIGVPGFRPEFASHALIANRGNLEDITVIPNLRFAKANCPFDMFHTLRTIHDHVDGAQLRVAPIGTKPHGLGSILYAISNPSNVQLIYDHPQRKARRTRGSSQVCVYEVSTFCESELFRQPIGITP